MPWTARHELHMFNQVEGTPAPADSPDAGWMLNRATGLVHLLCNCGYSTGWIPRDQMPTREQLLREHGTLNVASVTPDQQAEVAAWLTANGIDPDVVPLPSPITIEQGLIRYTALRRSNGRLTIDLSTGEPETEERTAPLAVPPPATVPVAQTTGASRA